MYLQYQRMEELNEKLLYTTIELESAKEEIKKYREYEKQLLNLLKTAYQERDEARDEHQKFLLKNSKIPTNPTELATMVLPFQPTKANSSITESNSLSEYPNHQSNNSSPVDSFFNPVSSPDFSNVNVVDSSNLESSTDHESKIIDNLVKGKALPQKGKLLRTLMETGPLLQNLLVAGPLPRWRNPPPILSFQIPQISILNQEAEMISQRTQPNSVMNFCSGSSGSCLGNETMLSNVFRNQIPTGKRQRFQ